MSRASSSSSICFLTASTSSRADDDDDAGGDEVEEGGERRRLLFFIVVVAAVAVSLCFVDARAPGGRRVRVAVAVVALAVALGAAGRKAGGAPGGAKAAQRDPEASAASAASSGSRRHCRLSTRFLLRTAAAARAAPPFGIAAILALAMRRGGGLLRQRMELDARTAPREEVRPEGSLFRVDVYLPRLLLLLGFLCPFSLLARRIGMWIGQACPCRRRGRGGASLCS
jgi:hypothetical protein